MKRATILFALLMISFAVSAQTKVYEDVNVQAFKTKMDSIPDAIILDLRTDEEVREGVIAQAVQIDYFSKDFQKQIDSLDRSKVYLVYCAGGSRSGQTKELMEEKGFRCVYNLEGGFTAWKKRKMPIHPWPRQ